MLHDISSLHYAKAIYHKLAKKSTYNVANVSQDISFPQATFSDINNEYTGFPSLSPVLYTVFIHLCICQEYC